MSVLNFLSVHQHARLDMGVESAIVQVCLSAWEPSQPMPSGVIGLCFGAICIKYLYYVFAAADGPQMTDGLPPA